MNIIIPIKGIDNNNIFQNENYDKPIPLINIIGKPIILHIIDNLKLKYNDNLIIIYHKKLNYYNFNIIIKNKYNNVILIELTKQTNCIIETILLGLNNLNMQSFYNVQFSSVLSENNIKNLFNKKCILLNYDLLYKINIIDKCRFFENIIISIDNINTYTNICYCFNNTNTLKYYCQKKITQNIIFNNVLSISYIIKEMIKDNNIF